MPENNYSLAGLHLPENKNLTRLLKDVSFIASLIILAGSTIVLLGWTGNIPLLKNLFLENAPVPMLSAVAFLLSAISLLFEVKIGVLKAGNKDKNSNFLFLSSYLICSFFVLLIGILQIINYFSANSVSFSGIFYNNLTEEKQAVLTVGFNFLLVGLALLYARLKVSHRFHLVQFLALNVFVINSITILGYAYRLFTPFPYSHINYVPLNIAIFFFFLSIAISFRWPGRGFIGMFTTDSVSSMFSLKVFFIKILIIAVLGLLILVGTQINIYNQYEALVIFAILLMVLSLVLTWLNIKLLYKFELERFIMKEELRVHNIDLKLDNESLVGKMAELKEANKEYASKLNYREKYGNVIDELS